MKDITLLKTIGSLLITFFLFGDIQQTKGMTVPVVPQKTIEEFEKCLKVKKCMLTHLSFTSSNGCFEMLFKNSENETYIYKLKKVNLGKVNLHVDNIGNKKNILIMAKKGSKWIRSTPGQRSLSKQEKKIIANAVKELEKRLQEKDKLLRTDLLHHNNII